MPAAKLAPGTVLSGRYQLLELIGESDLSTVYAATDQRGQAHVALKLFDPAVKARAAALSEYQAQARHASGLGVEGIARAYDFGIDANSGVPFSTAERIGWASLDRRVLGHGPLGVAELSRALTVLARALDAAHATQLVHRDLKPQNVFISPDNPEWVRLTDFGVNAVRRGAPEAMGWGGPPGYTPPDAVDANAPGSPAADLFALGVIAFFALTRGTPFRSLRNPHFDANAHWTELNQPLSPVSERAKEIGVALDPAFDSWFARALALAPHERFRSAGEMARELARLAEQASARGGGGPRTMPGIAAAIAQPLVFQPEPSPASLGLAPTSPVTTAAMAAVAAAPPPSASPASPSPSPTFSSPAVASAAEPMPALPKRSLALPLLIGLGVVLLSGLALAGYLVLGKSESEPAPQANATPSAAPPPPPVATAPSVANVEPASKAEASGTATPVSPAPTASTRPVVPVAKAPATPAAKPALAPTAGKPATAAPAAKATASAPTSKPAPTASTSKPATAVPKPASSAPAGKTSTKTKKKCSTFLGCK
jgi:eukaryotic-like serine/threonine-protein kinase